jgi:hypothetical protein
MTIAAAIRPHPLGEERRIVMVEPGTTLGELVGCHIPERWRHQARVAIAGHVVPADRWHRVRPRDGAVVEITVVPAGGSALRMALTVGVLAAAAWAGPAAAVALGGFGGAMVGAGVGTLGMLAINTLVPPPQPGLASGAPARPPTRSPGASMPHGCSPLCRRSSAATA